MNMNNSEYQAALVKEQLGKFVELLSLFTDPTLHMRFPNGISVDKDSYPTLTKILLELRNRLAPDDRDPNPAQAAGKFFVARYFSETSKEIWADAIRQFVDHLDRSIADLLAAGQSGHEFGIIRTADFAHVRLFEPNGQESYSVGCIGELPAEHPLRTLLPEEKLYRHGNSPALVLGLPQPGPLKKPRPFYSIQSAIQFTNQFRHLQEIKEEERKREEALEKKREEDRFNNSELGRRIRQDQELARYLKGGRLPEMSEPPITIRGAGVIGDH